MKCNAIAANDITLNGKKFRKGDTITDKEQKIVYDVSLSNLEFNNKHTSVTGMKLIPIEGVDEVRKTLTDKAKKLGIKFNPRIGNTKLLEKIQLIEPEFKI